VFGHDTINMKFPSLAPQNSTAGVCLEQTYFY